MCAELRLTLHDGDPHNIETSQFICSANQWTGLFMTGTSIVKDLSQLWLLFVLLGIDATLGDGCRIWEHLLNFKDVKRLQGDSKILCMGI